MRNYNNYLPLLMVLAAGCTSSEERTYMQQAAIIHQEALGVAAELKIQLAQTTLAVDSLSALQAAISKWEQDLVEVPGHDHDHGHAGLPIRRNLYK